jgi:dipeptidase E
VSTSGGSPEPVRGLGLLSGSLSVHLDGETARLPAFRSAIATGGLPGGYAADDGAALLYAGTRLRECVASRPGARVLRLRPDPAGGVVEAELPVRLLDQAEDHAREPVEANSVSELRALRAGRHRWD